MTGSLHVAPVGCLWVAHDSSLALSLLAVACSVASTLRLSSLSGARRLRLGYGLHACMPPLLGWRIHAVLAECISPSDVAAVELADPCCGGWSLQGIVPYRTVCELVAASRMRAAAGQLQWQSRPNSSARTQSSRSSGHVWTCMHLYHMGMLASDSRPGLRLCAYSTCGSVVASHMRTSRFLGWPWQCWGTTCMCPLRPPHAHSRYLAVVVEVTAVYLCLLVPADQWWLHTCATAARFGLATGSVGQGLFVYGSAG